MPNPTDIGLQIENACRLLEKAETDKLAYTRILYILRNATDYLLISDVEKETIKECLSVLSDDYYVENACGEQPINNIPDDYIIKLK